MGGGRDFFNKESKSVWWQQGLLREGGGGVGLGEAVSECK